MLPRVAVRGLHPECDYAAYEVVAAAAAAAAVVVHEQDAQQLTVVAPVNRRGTGAKAQRDEGRHGEAAGKWEDIARRALVQMLGEHRNEALWLAGIRGDAGKGLLGHRVLLLARTAVVSAMLLVLSGLVVARMEAGDLWAAFVASNALGASRVVGSGL
jgi:hypothetical protein